MITAAINEQIGIINPNLFNTAYDLSDSDVEISEEYLTRKFARPSRVEEKIDYELTNDPALLHQYYRLREETFIRSWGLKNFSGQKDEFDDQSYTVIARIGRLCIGGCRLIYKRPNSNDILPMEKNGFRLADLVPDMPINNVLCNELSRIAILPEYQSSTVVMELTRQICIHSMKKNTRFTYGIAPMASARNHRKIFNALGIKMEINRNVIIPEHENFEGIKMGLSMIDWDAVRSLKTGSTNKPTEIFLEEPIALSA